MDRGSAHLLTYTLAKCANILLNEEHSHTYGEKTHILDHDGAFYSGLSRRKGPAYTCEQP